MNKALAEALQGIEEKKGQDLVILDLSEICSFTDHFVLCTGTSSRQNQAIADAVQERTRAAGARPSHVEGYANAEWILLDFMDFVVHIFSPVARAFYDLERLWRDGRRVEAAELLAPAGKSRKSADRKSASRKKG